MNSQYKYLIDSSLSTIIEMSRQNLSLPFLAFTIAEESLLLVCIIKNGEVQASCRMPYQTIDALLYSLEDIKQKLELIRMKNETK